MVDEGLVEKRRGVGMYVVNGAKAKLIEIERQQFLDEEWPAILRRVARLGLAVDELPGG